MKDLNRDENERLLQMKDSYARRVRNGMKFLDFVQPDWYIKIDLNNLNMSSCHYCILGQLFTEYFYAGDKLGLSIQDRIKFGFTWRLKATAYARDLLQNEWAKQIFIRQLGSRFNPPLRG